MTYQEENYLARVKEAVEFIIKDQIENNLTGKKYFAYIAGSRSEITQRDICDYIKVKSFEYPRYFLGGKKLYENSDFDKTTIDKIIELIATDTYLKRNDVMDFIERVAEFRRAFNLPIREEPTLIPKEEYDLNYKLSKEENEEYMDACMDKDKVEVLDALVDEFYIWCGKVLSHGMQGKIKDAFLEIHGSNMSKLDENGLPIKRADGKVLKSPNYYKPNLKQFL